MVKIFLISGFLGAGKTTLLNNILSKYRDKKLAVIVNEYGDTGVDSLLIENKAIDIKEINGGSIFCTCRSDHFIEAIKTIGESGIDTIIVENSGLANPNSMGKIMKALRLISSIEFHYAGSICVVDSSTLEKVLSILPVAKSQIESSEYIILNKQDLIDSDKSLKVYNVIKTINEGGKIIETSFCNIENFSDIFLMDDPNEFTNGLSLKPIGVSKFEIFPQDATLDGLDKWLEEVKEDTLRIKGFVEINDEFYLIQSTLSQYSITPYKEVSEKAYIEIIMKSDDLLKSRILSLWYEHNH